MNIRLKEIRFPRLPRFLQEPIGESFKLRNPLSYVVTRGIQRFPTGFPLHWPMVQTRLARILPHHAVYCKVCVEKRVMEPLCSFNPVNIEIFYQEECTTHPHILVHPTGCPKLSHSCVDYRKAGLSTLPSSECLLVTIPFVIRIDASDRLRWHVWPMKHLPVRKVPPHQPSEESFRNLLTPCSCELTHHIPHGQLSKMNVWRQL
mmetsp:Transcript_15541/g.29918  ORF Transcript_15541/g.29918 Transcript_15541/m.29918 type:complete len:204 (-) Transcript_15541:139-750(-)